MNVTSLTKINNGLSRVKHVMVTTFLLVCGAMTMTWICDTVSESGFGTVFLAEPYFSTFITSVLGILFSNQTVYDAVVVQGITNFSNHVSIYSNLVVFLCICFL